MCLQFLDGLKLSIRATSRLDFSPGLILWEHVVPSGLYFPFAGLNIETCTPRHARKGFRCLVSSRRQRRSEEHTSELQSLMRISSAVFCLKKKNHTPKKPT